MEDTAEKYRTLKKLNFLIMKLNSLGNLPIDLEMPQKYSVKVLERMEASRKNKKNLKSHKG
jgi:antitoxin component of RelBE/YafQ-DinJ toxin-antitoxin module